MTCLICKVGEPEAGFTTITLERDGSIIVFKEVPAQVCPNCGETYIDSDVTSRLLTQAQDAVMKGAELEVIRLQAA
ncbi:type II toxin-antitoxin system MqsA family antitoxin [Spirosoma sp. KUDC1026]|uniref:type II toxin-antitoxin system MqsA family antitoxin n=1 Tax=Spirosoma sp. KUDC1026 TaxID=2745947 RepID=UPI00159BAC45|nr:type II toxin-antitoxin system MqsA family antitoxin [Spirosoma sp. KUDC1026]QKZ15012.1 type II toxin-antitoxin system MqsA family antitoxin [Spirosoma sp. KUDC1026]